MTRPCGTPAPDTGTGDLGPRTGGSWKLFRAWLLAGLCLALPSHGRAVTAAPLSFAPVLVEQREPGCSTDVPRDCAHVALRGLDVRHLHGPAALAIQRQLDWALAGEEGVGVSPAALAASFIDQFVSYRRRFPDAAPWFLERRVRLLSQRPGLLSFAIRTTRFAGGAHPASDVRFLDLDPRTGAPLLLDDLLAPGGVARLRDLARAQLREVQAAHTGADTAPADSIWATVEEEDDDLTLPDSAGVTADALVLAWDAYELGPYASGPRSVTIALSRLRGLLRANGPLAER